MRTLAWLLLVLLEVGAFAAPRYPRAKPDLAPPDRVKPLVPFESTLAPSLPAVDVIPMPAFTRLELLPEEPAAQDLYNYALTAAQRARDPHANPNVTKQYLLFAVKAFKALVDDRHRNFPQLDAALFAYGYTLHATRWLKEAGQVFDKLVKDHPASPFVASVHVVLGDHAFDAKRFSEAEEHYRRGKSPYATYKLAWAHLQQLRYVEALEAMHRVVTQTRHEQTPLAHAASTDYVLVFAETGKTDKALAVFKAVDPARALELYAQLAARYAVRGMFDRAVFVYRDLVAQVPADECTWRTQILRALMSMHGYQSSARREMAAIVELAQTSADPACRATGAALQSVEMRRYLAESAYANDDYVYASTAFADIASDRRTPKPLAIDAALASVLAYKTLLGIDPDLAPLVKRSATRKTALSTLETALLEAHALYATLVGDDDPALATMRFVEAAILRGHGNHEAAVPLLMDYLRVNPDDVHALRMLGDTREVMRPRR